MDFSQLGNARYAVLGVIVLVALWAGLKAWKWFAGAGERALAQQLADAIAAGDAKLAGDIQVRRGNLVEASRIFVRANEHARAGTVLAMLGQHKEAAEEYEKGSEWSKAGPLFKRVGDLARAAACFERSSERSDRMQAAECWFAGDEYLKAARLFQDCEEYERAADAFTKVDDLDALEVALTMLENAAIAEKDNAKRKKRLWTRAGEVGFKLGAHERAARAFDEAGETTRAADIYENALKKLDMAAVLYAEAGDTEKAERLTRAAGGEERVRETRLARARTRTSGADTEKSASDKPGRRSSDRSDEGASYDKASYDKASDKGSSNKGGGETGVTVVKKAVQSDAIDPTLPAAADARPEREGRKKSLDLGDRFEMAGELGRGGMGIVYRAKDQRLGRFVALKFLPDDVQTGSTMSRLFRREARAAAALSHPGIVTVYDVGEIDGREFIAMELVEGKTLDRTLEENGPLPVGEALDVMEKVLEAIEYAHGKSVIHRDIKPANLMRTKTGIKVMDFGLAKVIGSKSSGQTLVGGTPNYMPPEQSTGHADHRSDVFALGVTFYELLTGELPGRPGEPASVSSSYPTPRERVAAIPPRLSELIMHCLERERELRTQDVVSVLREVRSIKAELVSSPPKAPKAGPAAAPRAASTMARTEAAPRNAVSPRRADPIPRDEDPIPRREEPRREEPRRGEPRREERRDEPRRAEVRPAASTPAAQRKPLPARIAREEEDDDAGVPRVERLGPIDKSDGRKRR